MIISQITLVLLSKFQAVGKQVLYIMTIAIAAHILVLVVKKISKLIYAKTHKKATSKFRSITSLVTSTLVFIIYFWAIWIFPSGIRNFTNKHISPVPL